MNLRPLKKRSRERWRITDRMFLSLLLTGTTIELSQVGAGFIDGLCTSRYLGSEAMAARGIAHPIFSCLGIISGVLAVGMQTAGAKAIGKGKREEFSRIFSAVFYIGSALSLLITLLLICFSGPVSVLLGAAGKAASLVGPASDYVVGLGVGAPALIMTAVLAPALQLDSGRMTVQIGALIELSADVILDIVMIRAGLGIFGVGLATSVACYLNLLYQCLHFLKKRRMLHFSRLRLSLRELFGLLTDGSEIAFRRITHIIRPIILNRIIIAYGGAAAMTMLSIRNNFADFSLIFGMGIVSALALLTGLYYGEVNAEALYEVDSFKNRMVLLIPGSVCVLMLIFARPIAGLYAPGDEEALRMATFAIRMLALQNPLQILLISRTQYLQVLRRVKSYMALMLVQLITVLLSAFVLGALFGAYGVLACFTVGDLLSLLVIWVFNMIKSRRLLPTKKDFLGLPASFDLRPGDVISLDIRDKKDVSLASRQMQMFCEGHGIDQKIAYYASLSFEEVAVDLLETGFSGKNPKKVQIDLRAVIVDGTFVIRLCDNCPRHDITSLFAVADMPQTDIAKNIGARIVSRVAADIDYMRTFDTNNVTIRFRLDEPPAAQAE